MATEVVDAVPTTPPSTYVFGTAGEASILASLAGTNIANKGTVIVYSTDESQADQPSSSSPPQTVFYGSAASASGWNSLSDTAKYAIYAGAGAVVLIVIILISVLVVRKRRANKPNTMAREKAIRMTQRSSFASPMHDRGSVAPQAMYGQSRQAGDLSASYSTTSFQTYGKADLAHADAQSVHSIPPIYAANAQQTRWQDSSRRDQNDYGDADRSYSSQDYNQPLRQQYDRTQYQQSNAYADYPSEYHQHSQYPPQSPPHEQAAQYQERHNPYAAYAGNHTAYDDHAGHGQSQAPRHYRY